MRKSVLIIVLFCSFGMCSFMLNKRPKSYWPLLKGKWYYQYSSNDSLVSYARSPLSRRVETLEFISKDFCKMSEIQPTDAIKILKHKWASHLDTIRIYRKADTLVFKVIKATAHKLDFKPVE